MSDWSIIPIAEACRSIDYGLTASANEAPIGPKFLRITDIVSGCIDWDRVPYTERPERQERYQLHSGDVVIARTGASTGATAFLKEPPKAVFASYLVRLKAKDSFDPMFLYYQTKTPSYSQHIYTVAFDKGAQPNASAKALTAVELPFPPLPEQRKIASILGALDDKIELNRKTSATLEAMARALYRSWFVDFDPVHARSQGLAPAHMDKETAALFPDRFGDDGLPEGWGWRTFERHYTVLETGKRPKGGIGSVANGVPSIGAESIKKIGSFDFSKTKFVPRAFFETMKKGHLSHGDILIYKDGGKPGELRPAATYVSENFPFEEACINEHVFRVRIDEELGQYFGFLALSSDHCMQQMRELATGVAQPGLNQSAMKALSFLMPSEGEILKSFNRLVAPLLDGCNEKARESLTLATLRDTLLPRLMSGELQVGEAREQVEALV